MDYLPLRENRGYGKKLYKLSIIQGICCTSNLISKELGETESIVL